MAKTPYYTKAEADSKNQETLRDVKQTTEAISAGEGGKSYATLALAQAVSPKPINGTIFQVEEAANAGYYKFDSTQTGGTKFVRPFSPSSDEVGIKKLPANTNLLQELTNTAYINTEIWGSGYLNKLTNGGISLSSGWYYSKKYYRVVPGEYFLRLQFSENAAVVFYDIDYNIVSVVPNTSNPFSYNLNPFVVPANAEFIRISTNYASPSTLFLRNNNTITLKEYPFLTTGGIKKSQVPLNGKAVVNVISRLNKDRHPSKPKIPMVSFISDDGHIVNDEWYIPVLDTKEVKSSFAIITSKFNEANSFNKQRVRELYSSGHDIAGQSYTHQQTGTLALSEQETEIQKCKLELASLGINSEMFVVPFGSRTTDTDRIVRKYFKTDFISVADSEITAGTCANLPPINSYRLKRIKFDAEANGVSRLQVCKNAVDVALSTGGWLVFAIHPQNTEYSSTSNPSGYAARRQELSDLIDYIRLQNISILTAQQAYNIYKNPVELGNIGLDEKYYVLGMDGTEQGNYFE